MAGTVLPRVLIRRCAELLLLLSFSSSLLFGQAATAALQTDSPASIQTVVDLSVDELAKTYPELKNVDFASTREAQSLLLVKVRNRVEELFRDFPNTSSRERISLEMLNQNGATARSLTREFQYLLFAQSIEPERGSPNSAVLLSAETGKIKIEEVRTDSKGSEIDILKLGESFVVTGGYVTVPLHFHPYYQDGSVFRYVGRETTGNRNHVIAFAQLPEKARLAGSFHTSAGSIMFFVQGFAWIDPSTYQIVRMRTDLLKPLTQAGLMEQTTRIEMAEVQFSETGRRLWLPHEVVVNSRSMGYNFRNRHQYSRYRLFTVDAKDEDKRIMVPPKPPQ
jgi:hypothetical protein